MKKLKEMSFTERCSVIELSKPKYSKELTALDSKASRSKRAKTKIRKNALKAIMEMRGIS